MTLAVGQIIKTGINEWIVDDIKDGDVFMRIVRGNIAYLPGVRMSMSIVEEAMKMTHPETLNPNGITAMLQAERKEAAPSQAATATRLRVTASFWRGNR
jgi:hypothetical protein